MKAPGNRNSSTVMLIVITYVGNKGLLLHDIFSFRPSVKAYGIMALAWPLPSVSCACSFETSLYHKGTKAQFIAIYCGTINP